MGSTESDDEKWEWALSPRAVDQFDQLDDETKERIASKLDDMRAYIAAFDTDSSDSVLSSGNSFGLWMCWFRSVMDYWMSDM